MKAYKQHLFLLLSVLIGLVIWFCPRPAEVSPQGWHLFAIFVATVVGVVLRPLPMGVVTILSLTLTVITNTMTMTEAFSGFSH